MRLVNLVPILILLLDSCIEKLEVPSIYSTPGLVVDGLLTDDPGPHTIKLLITSPVEKDLDVIQYEGGATVRIIDDSGNEEILEESEKGIYVTSDDFKGQVGKKYQLSVVTEDDRTYQSDLIEMLPAGEILNISYEYKPNVLNQLDPTKPQHAVDVYLDGVGVAGYANRMRWRWKGIFQTKTYPEKRVRITPEGRIPDPIPCSGYIYTYLQGLIMVDECICCDCWPTEYSTAANVSSEVIPGNTSFTRIFLARLPVDMWRFYTKYYFEAEQLSVSDEVYRFWELLESQQAVSGDLFQPNVVQVKGNMRSLTDPAEEVFGIFSVSSVSRKNLFITRDELPGPFLRMDTVVADCRAYFKNSVNQKPPFW